MNLTLPSPRSVGNETARIIARLMRDNESLREENARLWIALRGYDVEPQSPFPLLSGDEIVGILHPEGNWSCSKNELGASAKAKRAIARLTHALVNQQRPGKEIIAEACAEADRWGMASESAMAISAAIIAENVGGERHV